MSPILLLFILYAIFETFPIGVIGTSCCTDTLSSDLDENFRRSAKNVDAYVTPCLTYGYGKHYENDRLCACVLRAHHSDNQTTYRYERCCESCNTVKNILFIRSKCVVNTTYPSYYYSGVSFSKDNITGGVIPIIALPNTRIYDELELDCECRIMRTQKSEMETKPYVYNHLKNANVVKAVHFESIDRPCKDRTMTHEDKTWSCGYITTNSESLEYCERARNGVDSLQLGIRFKSKYSINSTYR